MSRNNEPFIYRIIIISYHIISYHIVPSHSLPHCCIALLHSSHSTSGTGRLWDVGAGPPHTDAKLRLFGSSGEPRVIFYRDTAAWCPYCQKVSHFASSLCINFALHLPNPLLIASVPLCVCSSRLLLPVQQITH